MSYTLLCWWIILTWNYLLSELLLSEKFCHRSVLCLWWKMFSPKGKHPLELTSLCALEKISSFPWTQLLPQHVAVEVKYKRCQLPHPPAPPLAAGACEVDWQLCIVYLLRVRHQTQTLSLSYSEHRFLSSKCSFYPFVWLSSLHWHCLMPWAKDTTIRCSWTVKYTVLYSVLH